MASQPPQVSASRRLGRTRALPGLLLLAFGAQGFWLAAHAPLSETEMALAGAETASPAIPSAAPVVELLARCSFHLHPLWLVRLPFLAIGLLLGASLWYVARRLCGNAGGYVALVLYTFSPTMITYSSRAEPEIVAAWGVFGCIFTSIAVAHTLYAPREVVLWNWKRILLLGIAIALGAGAQMATLVAILFGLAFMLYLAPDDRRADALIIMAAGSGVGAVLLWAIHGFHGKAMAANAVQSGIFGPVPQLFGFGSYWRLLVILLLRNGPGFELLLAIALVTFCVWRRPRFFGTEAPLVTAIVLIALGLTFPYTAGFPFLVIALPFLFIFAAGVWADLLESRGAAAASGAVLAALAIHLYFSVAGLWRLR